MKTKHRRASHAKRKWQADPLAMFKTINKLVLYTDDEMLRITMPIRLSFEKLRSGHGAESDFHELAAAVNSTLIRGEQIDPLCEHTAIAARDALMRCWHRFERTGRWGFDGPALLEVEAGIDLHEQMCKLSSPLQMMNSMKTVIKRGSSGEVAA